MKRFLVFLLAAVFVMAAGSVLAQNPTDPTTPGSQESDVWYVNEAGEWVPNPLALEDRNGRLFRGGERIEGNCNKKWWAVDVEIHASIAQWVDFSLQWDRYDWFIRKPGCYAGNCIEACVASNSDILIDYEGFEDLQPSIAGNNPIPVWYSIETGGGFAEANAGWVTAAALNTLDNTLPDTQELHEGICWKLWNKICVIECNSACEYSDYATITLTLENQKDWIYWDEGYWWDDLP
jgi:hypothetical protein